MRGPPRAPPLSPTRPRYPPVSGTVLGCDAVSHGRMSSTPAAHVFRFGGDSIDSPARRMVTGYSALQARLIGPYRVASRRWGRSRPTSIARQQLSDRAYQLAHTKWLLEQWKVAKIQPSLRQIGCPVAGDEENP